jgi:TRAP-type C4-dicarboxylate transport system permease small subunit
MSIIQKCDKFFERIVFISKKLTGILMLVMICAVSVQVVARLLKVTVPWTEELGIYALIWMVFIGSVAVLIRGEHLTVDILLLRYTPSQLRIARIFISALLMVFCFTLFYFGVILCQNPIIINARTPAMRLPRLYIYTCLPISMFFSSLFSIYSLIVSVADCATSGRLRGGMNGGDIA